MEIAQAMHDAALGIFLAVGMCVAFGIFAIIMAGRMPQKRERRAPGPMENLIRVLGRE